MISLDGIAATVEAGAAMEGGAAPPAGAPPAAGGAAHPAAAAPAQPINAGPNGLAYGDVQGAAPTLRRDTTMDFRLAQPAMEECPPCENVGPPPMCPVCRHNHFQGTACDICGHVGKTVRATHAPLRPARRPLTPSPLPQNAPLRLFPPKVGPFPPILADPPRKPLALKLIDGASDDVDMKLCILLREHVFQPERLRCMRRRVPGVEGDVPVGPVGPPGAAAAAEAGAAGAAAARPEADALDGASAHVLATIGDMPVGTCRLRVVQESADASGTPQAWALDKLCVLQRYHRQCVPPLLLVLLPSCVLLSPSRPSCPLPVPVILLALLPVSLAPRLTCAVLLCRGLGTSIVEQTVENAKALPVFGTCSIVVADAPVEQGPFWQKLQFVACAFPLSLSPFPHSPSANVLVQKWCGRWSLDALRCGGGAAEDLGNGVGRFLRRLA